MKEVYVSFKIAQLMKENGFDWFTYAYYTKDDVDEKPYFGMENLCPDNWNGQVDEVNDLWYSAPTQQMACRWLREVHNIFVTVIPSELSGIMDYTYVIYRVDYSNHNFKVVHQGRPRKGSKRPCEDAVESALKYALKNLI